MGDNSHDKNTELIEGSGPFSEYDEYMSGSESIVVMPRPTLVK